jgi:beta-glucosidase
VPTLIDVFLARPAVLTGLVDAADAVFGSFGVDDRILLDAATGRAPLSGRLPFDLPRSLSAVTAAREDVPFDTEHPLFRFGHGLPFAAEAETMIE